MGDINPENASGKSIVATVKQSVVPLENVKANLYEWIEDIGKILLDMMGNYYGERPLVMKDENGIPSVVTFDFSVLKNTYLYTKCDVGNSSYWSEVASAETLDGLLQQGAIDIVEYLECMPNDFIANKFTLLQMVKERLKTQAGVNSEIPSDIPQVPENLV